jgi:magnesium-transporting ATPase (P-type)
MCFDKTGTLTEEGLDNYGVISAKYSLEDKKLRFSKLIKPNNIPLLG